MNKVVRSTVVAGDLPEQVRGDIDPSRTVRVLVEDLGDRATALRRDGARLLALEGSGAALNTSIDDAVRRVRDLRDQ